MKRKRQSEKSLRALSALSRHLLILALCLSVDWIHCPELSIPVEGANYVTGMLRETYAGALPAHIPVSPGRKTGGEIVRETGNVVDF